MEIAGTVLMVTDFERSLKFYVEGLGLEVGSHLKVLAGRCYLDSLGNDRRGRRYGN